ncbi:unnamed protein product [Rotaria sordida]|uniref:NADP-dependent oxidoreductase domain-containing protein n=1 Tax=Rotaria sordida TaxID=392033 RepID=A0A819P666_9BILA|nr:unnamed protein product [Rotaria sordida]
MATSSTIVHNVYLPADAIPTAETRIKLADRILISPLVLGTWAWGDTRIWNWTPESDPKAKDAFDISISKGINTFDTAEGYGNGESERCIARYKENHPAATDIVIATKFFPTPFKLFYPSSLISALRESLARLKVECVDLYQIHGPIHLRSIEVIGDALAEAVKLGLTKTVGVSNYSTAEMIRMYDCLQKHGIQLASNQVEYSLIRRLPETSGHIAECHKRGVAVLGYCPLGMGGLTGKYSRANPPPGNRVIPLGGAKDGNQAEQNAECLGWRLTNEEITELENHPINRQPTFFESIWQHG